MAKSWLVGQSTIALMSSAYLLALLSLIQDVFWWVGLISVIAMGWRWLYATGQVLVFNRYLLAAICMVALALLGTTVAANGLLITMINLLLLGYGLKFIELKARRDVFFLVLVGLITAGIVVLFYSDISALFKIIPLVILHLAILLVTCAPAYHWLEAIKESARILAVSLPLTLILFLLMPKLAPLWQVSSAKNATTGLSDQLYPGDIASLSHSSELAFSVTFELPSQLPPRDKLYWRALVMADFDGQRWRQSQEQQRWQTSVKQLGLGAKITSTDGLSYQIIANATQQSWLYGLALPFSNNRDILVTPDQTIYAAQPLTTKKMYQVISSPALMAQVKLSPLQRATNLQLAEDFNPQTKRWGTRLRLKYPNDDDFINAVLNHFNQQQFYYTLNPPLLGQHSIDDFMFGSQRGFCAHYASAFTVIMRQAGIPARVVAGYQGGEWNQDIGYLNVYQYDAHAWSEVWLPGRGWVRKDPTASVAPARIEFGLAEAMQAEQSFLSDSGLSLARYQDSEWLNRVRLGLANVNYFWNRWLLGYDKKSQYQLFKSLMGDVSTFKLLGLTIGCFVFISLWLIWHAGFRVKRLSYNQKIDTTYLALCDRLAQAGITRSYHTATVDYCALVVLKMPTIKDEMIEFTKYYNYLKYSRTQVASKDHYRKIKMLAKKLLNKI